MTDPGYLTDHIDLNGRIIRFRDITSMNPVEKGNSEFESDVIQFLKEWLSDQQTFRIKTSGSTGYPKTIILSREQMVASAEATIHLFRLNPGYRALLCLPAKYIAGKMMIVRSITGNMELIAREPAGNPLAGIREYVHITAMVPLQLSKILESDSDKDKLSLLKTILIGGGPVSKQLEAKFSQLEPEIYHTYGMTETVTHIAVRKISGNDRDNTYKTLPGIQISTDARNCLVIKGEITGGKKLISNDIVELQSDSSFKWLGRIDQVINSGGIKVIPELLEEKISTVLAENGIEYRFFITGIPDDQLGQKVIMVIEFNGVFEDTGKVLQVFKSHLSPYEIPKEILSVHPFQYTESGKINKVATIKSINFTSTK